MTEAAGYIEGLLTCVRISEFYANSQKFRGLGISGLLLELHKGSSSSSSLLVNLTARLPEGCSAELALITEHSPPLPLREWPQKIRDTVADGTRYFRVGPYHDRVQRHTDKISNFRSLIGFAGQVGSWILLWPSLLFVGAKKFRGSYWKKTRRLAPYPGFGRGAVVQSQHRRRFQTLTLLREGAFAPA